MTAPLMRQDLLPTFQHIDPTTMVEKLKVILAANRKTLAALLDHSGPYTWANLMQPMEDMNEKLSQFWSPISHLHSVMETDELRNGYNDALPLLVEYGTELSQNEQLYKAIVALSEGPEFSKLSTAQRKIIENDIRDFTLDGIHLSADKKTELAALLQQKSQAITKFSENLLDATKGWILHVTDAADLAGLPEQALQLAVDNAKRRDLSGYVITLDGPSYTTALKYLNNRQLRQEIYTAYVTRASDRGPNAGQWDNSSVMDEILKIRYEIARLVGFENYAEYSLKTKMAKKPQEVLHFLEDLLIRSKPLAQAEFKDIAKLALKEDGIADLQPWDIQFYSEKLRGQQFNFSPEDIRPYFPINKVLSGMFTIVNKIYGIKIEKQEGVETWHPQVEFFVIYDSKHEIRGGFYTDLYARTHKRDGAWMDDARTRRVINGKLVQYPIAYLTCNFMPPIENQPALLTHDDVITLFHEFGHCLHHMLTKVDYPGVGGINGVPWDAVEFPSQFMENFCWEKESLSLLSEHYQTGQPLPDELYEKMLAAKHFQTGLQMVRQLEFSLFDFHLHLDYQLNKTNQVQTILDQVRSQAAVTPIADFNRFQHSFSHVFAGGYAAGYYSYKWAEVLSSDAYSQFQENGIFDAATGKSFMENILEMGGARDPMASFVAFRGREPTIDALLVHSGIQ